MTKKTLTNDPLNWSSRTTIDMYLFWGADQWDLKYTLIFFIRSRWVSCWFRCEICSQSRSQMINTTQELWQWFAAWLRRWAASLCVFTLILVSLSPHTEAHTPPTSAVCLLSEQQGLKGRYCITVLVQGHRSQVSVSRVEETHTHTHTVNLRGSDLPQLQEGWGELVSHETAGVGVTMLFISC